jgi:hypothetical protein
VYRLGEDWTGRESIQVGRGMYRLGEWMYHCDREGSVQVGRVDVALW